MLTFKPFSNLTELSLTNLNDGKNIVWDRYIDIINFYQLTSLKSFSASNLPLSELDAAQLPPQLKRINIYGVGMKRIKNEDLFDQLSSIHLEIDIDGACQKYRYPQVRWNDIWCEE
ncbi:MAG: hypothetical protein Q4B28_03960 [bacterium]|nr:hypothetical protein [bacterium]